MFYIILTLIFFTYSNVSADITNVFYYKVINPQSTPDQTITIDIPGTYKLTNDAFFNPTATEQSVILTTTNNVTLDLNGKTLSMIGTTTEINGIEVDPNLSNIVIRNGIINNLTGVGISIGSSCSRITIENIEINSCDAGGVSISSSNNINIKNISVSNCDGSATSVSVSDGAFGIKLDTCKNVKVLDSNFNNNQSPGTPPVKNGSGVFLTGCNDCVFENCEASTNRGNNAYGFRLQSSTNSCKLLNCTAIASDNNSGSGTAFGFSIDSSNNNIITNCFTSGNASNTSVARGFSINSGNNNRFTKCISSGNSSTNSSSAGFLSRNGSRNQFIECESVGNTCGNGSSALSGVGFSLGVSEEDPTATESNDMIMNCTAAFNGNAAGITSGAGNGLGIRLQDASFCVINNNSVYNNVGVTAGYGIRDTASPSRSLYTNNFAYGNRDTAAAPSTTVNNYDISPAPDNSTVNFPSVIAFLTEYNIIGNAPPKSNIEVIEKE